MAKKLKPNVRYFYTIRTAKQLDFNKHEYEVEVLVTGHIVVNEVLMCGLGRDLAKNRDKAKKFKLVNLRIPGVPMCEECIEKYKARPGTDWSKWVNNTVSNEKGRILPTTAPQTPENVQPNRETNQARSF